MYAKPPFGGPEAVLKYLGRYTHRIAISNRRLLEFQDGQVTFAYRNREAGDERRTMKLPAPEFLRRFLLHVLPRGFQRIRHYGFLANTVRRSALALCRAHLAAVTTSPESTHITTQTTPQDSAHDVAAGAKCPRCVKGRLVRHAQIPAAGRWRWRGKETGPP